MLLKLLEKSLLFEKAPPTPSRGYIGCKFLVAELVLILREASFLNKCNLGLLKGCYSSIA
jgi:hypothetical protein